MPTKARAELRRGRTRRSESLRGRGKRGGAGGDEPCYATIIGGDKVAMHKGSIPTILYMYMCVLYVLKEVRKDDSSDVVLRAGSPFNVRLRSRGSCQLQFAVRISCASRIASVPALHVARHPWVRDHFRQSDWRRWLSASLQSSFLRVNSDLRAVTPCWLEATQRLRCGHLGGYSTTGARYHTKCY